MFQCFRGIDAAQENVMSQDLEAIAKAAAEGGAVNYQELLALDNAFQAELVRQFDKAAGDARYNPSLHDERTKAAADALRVARIKRFGAPTVAFRGEEILLAAASMGVCGRLIRTFRNGQELREYDIRGSTYKVRAFQSEHVTAEARA